LFDFSAGRRSCGAIALLTLLLCVAPIRAQVAVTPQDAFTDGNRLFRDDLYWAALLRYRQAADAGMDTPLLHYNTGVAHYRAKQHVRARQSLLRAAQAPELRVLSQYNLGLNAYAAGNVDEALDWFRQARDQEENTRVRQLATIAISRLQTPQREQDTLLARVESRQQEREITSLDLWAHVGFGSDSNIFRSPSTPYVDFANPNLPLVVPEEFSGAYLPVDLEARYWLNTFNLESFYFGYRLSGRYYQDKELENGDEFSHEARFGSEYAREEEGFSRRVSSAFTFAQHEETYYDPDDGLIREVDGEPIEDRLNYTRWGPQIAFRQGYDRFSFGVHLKGQLWNYETVDVVPEYDHEYFVLGGIVQYRFTPTALLRFGLEKSSRRFGARPSFDLDGQQPATSPPVRYDYLEARLTARQRLGDSMWFGFIYERSERTDRYLGYNDYSRDHYELEFRWRAGRRASVQLRGFYRNYDYPNAFAFHNPAAGAKTLETAELHALVSYRMTDSLSLELRAEAHEAVSTDPRIAYDRTWYSLGVSWRR